MRNLPPLSASLLVLSLCSGCADDVGDGDGVGPPDFDGAAFDLGARGFRQTITVD